MKTLALLRHAKAVEKDDFLAEHDRVLAPRGEQDAALVGRYMREQGVIPDRVLCSTAARAQRTWELVAHEIGKEIPVEAMRELYNVGSGGLFETIRHSGGAASVLCVVGHNPGMHALAVALCGSGDPEALDGLRKKLSTGALVELRVPIDGWNELAPGRGTLERFVRPKDLRISAG